MHLYRLQQLAASLAAGAAIFSVDSAGTLARVLLAIVIWGEIRFGEGDVGVGLIDAAVDREGCF